MDTNDWTHPFQEPVPLRVWLETGLLFATMLMMIIGLPLLAG